VDHLIILFDGMCNLCTWSVQFIIKRDPVARFRFASLQSPIGQRLLTELGVSSQAIDSFVLIEGRSWHINSDAALRVTRHLSGLWPLLTVLCLLPRSLRDWGYARVASNRYRWFGQPDMCMVPSPAIQDRFLA
jgi:predicted DCC family thiol-disulfide oxidoreductase YuxK